MRLRNESIFKRIRCRVVISSVQFYQASFFVYLVFVMRTARRFYNDVHCVFGSGFYVVKKIHRSIKYKVYSIEYKVLEATSTTSLFPPQPPRSGLPLRPFPLALLPPLCLLCSQKPFLQEFQAPFPAVELLLPLSPN